MKTTMPPASGKAVLMLLGPFPPPFGGIANLTAQLAASDLGATFDLRTININLPSEKTENVSGKRNINVWKVIRLYGLLFAALRKYRPAGALVEMNGDVSCFREVFATLIIRLFSRATIVTHFHGGLNSIPRGWRGFPFGRWQAGTRLGRWALRACWTPSHRVVFLARHLVDEIRPYLHPRIAAKITVIENFVAVDEFLPHQAEDDGRVHILFLARLSEAKGFFDLLEAIPAVVREHPEALFWICGAPETESALNEARERIACLEASGSLKLLGLVRGEQKQQILARSDIMVYPTHVDVFPVTVLEALAQGLPLVTTPIGGIPYIVREPENALFSEKGNAASLSACLLRLLADPALRRRMGEANHALAQSRFDIRVATHGFLELLLQRG